MRFIIILQKLGNTKLPHKQYICIAIIYLPNAAKA